MGLKTKEYYYEIASKLTFQTKAVIDGELCDASDGKTYKDYNPGTGEFITEVAYCSVEDTERAIKSARRAFNEGVWKDLNASERKEILFKFSKLIAENQDELAVMESIDSGKPINDTYLGDIPDSVLTINYYAEAIDKIQDEMTVGDKNHVSMIVKEPIGVVAAIVPWNFPLLMYIWKIAPILATGCSVVVKPATVTPLTALRVAELALEAGIPAGVLNVVPGSGSVIGDYLAKHPDIDAITFTGSTQVGKGLLGCSGESNAKRVFLEMGGKNPGIVMPDLKELDNAVQHAVNAVFWNMGENCTSNAKLLVHNSIKEEFVRRVVEETKANWHTGDPLDPKNNLGAIIEKGHMQKILDYIEIGKKEGAKLLLGGEQILKETGGNFIAPTIFDDVTPDMTIAKEEIFGPVLAIIGFDTEEEAIALANDTEYGLQASIYTDDLSTAHRMARAINAGTVSINCYAEGDITTPFGGFKQSGFFGRDKSLYSYRQYMEIKTIWIQI